MHVLRARGARDIKDVWLLAELETMMVMMMGTGGGVEGKEGREGREQGVGGVPLRVSPSSLLAHLRSPGYLSLTRSNIMETKKNGSLHYFFFFLFAYSHPSFCFAPSWLGFELDDMCLLLYLVPLSLSRSASLSDSS